MIARRPLDPEARRLILLAWPVVLTSLNWTLLHVTDIAVVGLVGSDQVAILGASRTLSFIAITAGFAGLSGILVNTSRADGARDLPATGRALREGLVLALAIGMAIGLILHVFAAPMLWGVGVNPVLIPATARVITIMAIAYPLQMIVIAISFFLEGISRPQRVMMVNLAILPFNGVLAWAWSGGHLGLPALGAAGAASATAVAAAVSAAGLLWSVWTLPRAEPRGVRDLSAAAWSGISGGALRLARFGTMPAVATGLELAGFSILIALSTQLGMIVAHGFQIVFSLHNVTFSIAMGLGSATGVRVGNAVGEGVPAAGIGRTLTAVRLTVIATGAVVLVVMAARAQVVGLFPAGDAVHLVTRSMLLLWLPFVLCDAVQVVLVYALRSLGDQVVAGINSILAFFVITGGAGWLLFHYGWGATGLVLASGIGMASATLLHALRFAQISRRVRVQS